MTLCVQAQDTGAFFTRPRPAVRQQKSDSAAAARALPLARDTPTRHVTPAQGGSAARPAATTPAGAASRSATTPVPVPAGSASRPATRAPADTAHHEATAAATAPMPPRPAPSALPSFSDSAFAGVRQLTGYLLGHNRLFHGTDRPEADMAVFRVPDGESGATNGSLFYVIAGVLFLLALIRFTFTKYFSDLVRAFFNPTLSQRQLREQLSQTPFPALLLNVFFTLSAGLYLFLILRHAHYITVRQPLVLIPVFMGLIMVVYLVKYAFLRFTGWLFNYPEVTTGYVFTLYMVNKVLGVALVPFILVVAFSDPPIATVALNISVILIVLLFVYRYVRSYALVKNQIFFNKFQFFIYLCGFEIAPVLIIGKLVLLWLNGA